MPTLLKDAFPSLLKNWRSDLDPRWQAVLNIEPAFAKVQADLDLAANEVIFPGRKGRAPAGARPDSHIFRALDGIGPDQVSTVVIGQDPYTQVTQATGRSFEQGDLANWLGKPKVTPSLKRIIQALATARTGEKAYVQPAGGWQRLVADIRAGSLTIPPPQQLWDHWQKQGVIFINAILTFNRYQPSHQFQGHGSLWAPVVQSLLTHLVRRPANQPVVFVTWGDKAASAFAKSGARAAAAQAGAWNKSVLQITRPHPNAIGPGAPFLLGENPFTQINHALTTIGAQPVNW